MGGWTTAGPWREIRIGLPSKGRMAADTLDLLKVLVLLFRILCLVPEKMAEDEL